jgi:hypothetical protein
MGMRRREFLQRLAVLPLLGGCTSPVVYDRATHGPLRRVGLVDYPHRFDSQVSRDVNMYSRAGEDSAIARRLREALDARCQGFGPNMRNAIAAALAKQNIGSSIVPYKEDEGEGLNPIYRKPIYKNTQEPTVLECQISLCFGRAGDGLVPGAGSFSRLATPDGQVLWRSSLTLGPSGAMAARMLAMPTARFKDVREIVSSPDRASAELMALAAPLGSAIAAVLLADNAGSAGTRSG